MSERFAAPGYGTVGIARRGAVGILRLQRPDRLNAYTPEMGEDLVAAFRALAADEAVAAVVVTGEGRAFCAGADRDCFSRPPGLSGLRIGEEAFLRGFAHEMHAYPKLLIAAFNGAAVGIGVSMSLTFDIRLAAAGALLKLNFAEHGIMPGFGATHMLPRLVGPGRARKLLLCEPEIRAEDALSIGLVDEVCAPDALIARACVLGEAAARLEPATLTGIKRALDAGLEQGFAAAVATEAASDLKKESKADIAEVRFDDVAGLERIASAEFGDWGREITLDQEMIDRFAELSGDRQWIHVDPERARREGPFGAAVAHGMLVLSAIPAILPANRWRIVGHGAAVNYGSDGLRFLSPVPAGARIHARARLAGVSAHPKGSLLTVETAVHVVGQEKPALLYRAQILYLPKTP